MFEHVYVYLCVFFTCDKRERERLAAPVCVSLHVCLRVCV